MVYITIAVMEKMTFAHKDPKIQHYSDANYLVIHEEIHRRKKKSIKPSPWLFSVDYLEASTRDKICSSNQKEIIRRVDTWSIPSLSLV